MERPRIGTRLPRSLTDAVRYFSDPALATAFIVRQRWPAGVWCPHCRAEEPALLTRRSVWKCRECRRQFSVKAGTILAHSRVGIEKWLAVIWAIVHEDPDSTHRLARSLGLTQATIWHLSNRVRLAARTPAFLQHVAAATAAPRVPRAHSRFARFGLFVRGIVRVPPAELTRLLAMEVRRRERVARSRAVARATQQPASGEDTNP